MKHFTISRSMTYRLVAGLVILVLIGVYIQFNPPFKITIVDQLRYPYNIFASIDNNGPVKFVIQDVLVNGKEQPEGIPLVRIIPSHIETWWPAPYSEEWTAAIGAGIKPNLNYGFWVWSLYPIEAITIKYRYLGIPFSYTIEVPEA